MGVQITYRKKAARKSIRIAKATSTPLKGTYVVRGTIASNTTKTLQFAVVSPAQQMRERNSAYHFFSLD